MNSVLSKDIYLNGENIPRDQVLKIFRLPPNIPPHIDRSAIIVGSRGSGKTMLFRYLKEKHKGVSIHIPASDIFANIARQSGSGALEFDFPVEIVRLISNKAVTLIAVAIAHKLFLKGISVKHSDLVECFPSPIPFKNTTIDDNYFETAKRELAKYPLQNYEYLSFYRPLCNLFSSLGERVIEVTGNHLLLLFDKTDSVPAPTLIPLIETLDQSSNYVALLSLRPGHGANVLEDICNIAIPGDHYGFFQLGQHPRSAEWKSFLRATIEAQIGSLKDLSLTDEGIEAIVITSRDVPRLGLEICQALRLAAQHNDKAIIDAIKYVCENALQTAEDSLRRWRHNFREFASDLRDEATEKGKGKINLPVILQIKEKKVKSLFPEFKQIDRLCAAALRLGVVHVPENETWTPLSRPMRMEIAPYVLWHEDNPLWKDSLAGNGTIIEKKEKEILQRSFQMRIPKIFIGYRMKFTNSLQFRFKLEQAIKSHPNLAHCEITDGNVPVGADWAPTIRKRLESSNIVIGDVTGMRGDILFELGFARGLKKIILPVFEKEAQKENLPKWLSSKQIGHYENDSGLQQICISIDLYINRKNEYGKISKLPDGVPGTAVWIGNVDWAKEAQEIFRSVAKYEGFVFNACNLLSFEDVLKACSLSSLIVFAISSPEADAQLYFLAGTVVANESIGYGKKLKRQVLLIVKNNIGGLIPDSMLHCDIINFITKDELKLQIQSYRKIVQHWQQDAPKRKGKGT